MNFNANIDGTNFDVVNDSQFDQEVTDVVKQFFQTNIINSIQQTIQNQANGIIQTSINAAILAGYPTTLNMAGGLSMATGLVGSVVVNTDYISIPIDASVYLTANGYERTATAAAIPTSAPSAEENVSFFIGQYFLTTLTKAVNSQLFEYHTSIFLFPVTVDLPAGTTLATFGDDVLTLMAQPMIHIIGFLEFDGNVTVHVSPEITAGGSANVAKVFLKLHEVEINHSVFKIFDVEMPHFISDIMAFFIKLFSNSFIPAIAIPKGDTTQFSVSSALVSLKNGFMKAGIKMNFK